MSYVYLERNRVIRACQEQLKKTSQEHREYVIGRIEKIINKSIFWGIIDKFLIVGFFFPRKFNEQTIKEIRSGKLEEYLKNSKFKKFLYDHEGRFDFDFDLYIKPFFDSNFVYIKGSEDYEKVSRLKDMALASKEAHVIVSSKDFQRIRDTWKTLFSNDFSAGKEIKDIYDYEKQLREKQLGDNPPYPNPSSGMGKQS